MIDSRRQALGQWFAARLGLTAVELQVVSADASFRRYFRYLHQGCSYILVDAPPATEKNQAFIGMAKAYGDVGLMVPRVLFADLEQGFLCLTDLGDNLLLDVLDEENRQDYYRAALGQLPLLAQVRGTDSSPLGCYDRDFFSMELSLFKHWFLNTHLGLALDEAQSTALDNCFSILLDNALEQPQVAVHRDYHSRNLMMVNGLPLGVIDFQDTVTGPITYDAVSLLRDCYIRLPVTFIAEQRDALRLLYIDRGLLGDVSAGQFTRWFDLMGMQRHLKVCGIFSRLHHRDGKSAYLDDLPLVLAYLVEVGEQYSELTWLADFLKTTVLPMVETVRAETICER